jgi:hypothetical protein
MDNNKAYSQHIPSTRMPTRLGRLAEVMAAAAITLLVIWLA